LKPTIITIFIRFTSNILHLEQLEALLKVANKPADVALVTEEMATEEMEMEGMVNAEVDGAVAEEEMEMTKSEDDLTINEDKNC